MRLAVIDIGTNSILLLVADALADGTVVPLRDDQVIARLGKGVDADKSIHPQTFSRVGGFLKEYVSQSRDDGANVVVATGTSALRDASNSEEFLSYVHAETGLDIRILSGEEEAFLTYEGVLSEFGEKMSGESFAILDIGGGSTELVTGKGFTPRGSVSVDIGSVRVTERHFGSGPISERQLSSARADIRSSLASLPRLASSTRLIGVAGTVTTLAALALNLKSYDPVRITGFELTRETILGIFDGLKAKTVEEIRSIPQITPGREDVIRAGILLLSEILDHLGKASITASVRGLRYGVALRKARGQF